MRGLITLIVASLVTTTVADEPATIALPQQPPAAAAADDQQPAGDQQRSTSVWMEKKLEYSQEILRGLATGDLELVSTKARQMRVLSRWEGWTRKGKPGYTAQLQAFNFANAEIERQAEAGSLEGAAMGFQQLTISCVSCHVMMRHPD